MRDNQTPPTAHGNHHPDNFGPNHTQFMFVALDTTATRILTGTPIICLAWQNVHEGVHGQALKPYQLIGRYPSRAGLGCPTQVARRTKAGEPGCHSACQYCVNRQKKTSHSTAAIIQYILFGPPVFLVFDTYLSSSVVTVFLVVLVSTARTELKWYIALLI